MKKTEELKMFTRDRAREVMLQEEDVFKPNTYYVEIQGTKHTITIEADDDLDEFRLEVRHFRLQRESGLKHVDTIDQVITYINKYGYGLVKEER